MQCTVLYCTVLYCTVLYCTVLCCIVVYCIVSYCNALHRTIIETIQLTVLDSDVTYYLLHFMSAFPHSATYYLLVSALLIIHGNLSLNAPHQ